MQLREDFETEDNNRATQLYLHKYCELICIPECSNSNERAMQNAKKSYKYTKLWILFTSFWGTNKRGWLNLHEDVSEKDKKNQMMARLMFLISILTLAVLVRNGTFGLSSYYQFNRAYSSYGIYIFFWFIYCFVFLLYLHKRMATSLSNTWPYALILRNSYLLHF